MCATICRETAPAEFESPEVGRIGLLARRGAWWSALLSVTRNALGLAATVLLSRLLVPDDYGLVGMAATMTVFLQAFADMGLSWATIQRKRLTRAEVDNLFWINAAVGILLWGVSAVCAPGLAVFFGRGELTGLAIWMGAAFAVSGLAVQPMAVLVRSMRFKAIFWVEFMAVAVGAATAAAMAVMGFGFWALVGQILASHSARLMLVLAASRYVPGPPTADRKTLSLLKFGGALAVYNMINYVSRNFDNVVIGWSCGSVSLAYYSRAYFLMSIPALLSSNTLTGVMVTSMSTLRHDPAQMAHAYRKAISAIALTGLPMAGFLFVAAPELVRMLYGPRWSPVVPPLRWLAVAAMVQVVMATSGWLYIVTGRGWTMVWVGSVTAAVLVIAFLVGIRWGIEGVAATYAVANLVLFVPLMAAGHQVASMRLSDTLRALLPGATSTLLAMSAGLAVGVAAGPASTPWASVLAAKAAAGSLILAGCGAFLARRSMATWPATVRDFLPGRGR